VASLCSDRPPTKYLVSKCGVVAGIDGPPFCRVWTGGPSPLFTGWPRVANPFFVSDVREWCKPCPPAEGSSLLALFVEEPSPPGPRDPTHRSVPPQQAPPFHWKETHSAGAQFGRSRTAGSGGYEPRRGYQRVFRRPVSRAGRLTCRNSVMMDSFENFWPPAPCSRSLVLVHMSHDRNRRPVRPTHRGTAVRSPSCGWGRPGSWGQIQDGSTRERPDAAGRFPPCPSLVFGRENTRTFRKRSIHRTGNKRQTSRDSSTWRTTNISPSSAPQKPEPSSRKRAPSDKADRLSLSRPFGDDPSHHGFNTRPQLRAGAGAFPSTQDVPTNPNPPRCGDDYAGRP